MSNVIVFFDRVPAELHDDAVLRGYVRYRERHHQMQIERKLLLEQRESSKEEVVPRTTN